MSIGKTVGYLLIGTSLACLSFSFLHDMLQHPEDPQVCNNGNARHEGLSESKNPILHKLQEYEAACQGSVVDQLMVFEAMPTSADESSRLAASTSDTLKEFARFNISPLVVFEPNQSSPTIISDIRDGHYDTVLKNYFASLKAAGITDQQMGTWVLFPEANTPTWHNTNADDFQKNTRKVASFQKEIFPTSNVSIMLNSRTYPSDDTSWNHGELTSLAPYVNSLPNGLVDSFGYQGFPFQPPANTSSKDIKLTVDTFLPTQLALDAAQKLGARSLWLNTGTYAAMYANDPAAKVTLSSGQRSEILTAVINEAAEIQSHGYATSINIFAEDKSLADEHTNWAYWTHGSTTIRNDTDVLKTFLHQLRSHHLGFALYDHE